MPWVDTWCGGRVWRDASGVRTYHIRRTINGTLYELSTRCTNEAAALSLAAELVPALDGAPSRKQRIEVIKALYGWLREERHVLRMAEDPTLDLAVPQARPEQAAKEWRPHLLVLAGTGWHVSARSGRCPRARAEIPSFLNDW
jgi:hypothetical protein